MLPVTFAGSHGGRKGGLENNLKGGLENKALKITIENNLKVEISVLISKISTTLPPKKNAWVRAVA